MSIEAASIEDKRFIRIQIDSGICIPKISVHERGFDGSALALQRAKKTRNDFIEEDRDKHIELGVMSLCFEFEFESPPHTLCKVGLPACFPLVHLGQITAISGYVEAEFAIRRLAVLVERCQTSGKFMRVWHLFYHVSIAA